MQQASSVPAGDGGLTIDTSYRYAARLLRLAISGAQRFPIHAPAAAACHACHPDSDCESLAQRLACSCLVVVSLLNDLCVLARYGILSPWTRLLAHCPVSRSSQMCRRSVVGLHAKPRSITALLRCDSTRRVGFPDSTRAQLDSRKGGLTQW